MCVTMILDYMCVSPHVVFPSSPQFYLVSDKQIILDSVSPSSQNYPETHCPECKVLVFLHYHEKKIIKPNKRGLYVSECLFKFFVSTFMCTHWTCVSVSFHQHQTFRC